MVATALIAAIDVGRHFAFGRALAAWIGFVPRQYTTGGKPRLGGIDKRGNHYLRHQLIHGARSVLIRISPAQRSALTMGARPAHTCGPQQNSRGNGQ
nr:IS110 family transposase [Desulfovibrio inopinatus]